MLWPVVLPSKITFYILLGVLIVATIIAQSYYRKGARTCALGAAIAILLFVPCCTVVQKILDPYRFGVFTYPNFQSVHDFRIERYLPESATNITVNKQVTGFQAKFTISRQALDDFFERQWEARGKDSKLPRETPKPYDRLDWFNGHIAGLGKLAPGDSIAYEGPRASNGAGFTVLYSESEGVAYQLAAYW